MLRAHWNVGDGVALRDRVYHVYRVVYLGDEVRGTLMLEDPSARRQKVGVESRGLRLVAALTASA